MSDDLSGKVETGPRAATGPTNPTRSVRGTGSANRARGGRDARIGRREQARQALLDAANAALEQRPWPEITIDDLTRSAGISRTAFYQHFIDRQQLLLTLLEQRAAEFGHVGDPWISSGADPRTELRATLAGIVALFSVHGRLMQAVRDASVTDAAVADAWHTLLEGLIAITVTAIERDRSTGHTTIDDAQQIARALTRMNEGYLLDSFGRHPLTDPDTVTRTLTHIWLATLFG